MMNVVEDLQEKGVIFTENSSTDKLKESVLGIIKFPSEMTSELKQEFEDLSAKLSKIEKLEPPNFKTEIIDFLSESFGEKLIFDILIKRANICIHKGDFYCTKEELDKFIKIVNQEFQIHKITNEVNDVKINQKELQLEENKVIPDKLKEENKEDLEEKKEIQINENSKHYKPIRVRPSQLSYFIAPYYYKLVIELLESKIRFQLQDEFKHKFNSISIQKSDKHCSFSYLGDEADFIDNEFHVLKDYAIEFERILEKLIKKDKDGQSTKAKKKQIYWWHFTNNNGVLIPYSQDANDRLESYFQRLWDVKKEGKTLPNYTYLTINETKYTVELDPFLTGFGIQTNQSTSRVRDIKRQHIYEDQIGKANLFDKKELVIKPLIKLFHDSPASWIQLEHLSFKTSIYNMISVDLNSDEAIKIYAQMLDSIPDLKIHRIERVQNLVAYHKYINEKKLMELKYDEDFDIEKRLFHGTRNTDPISLVSAEEGRFLYGLFSLGFDMRFSREGMWGKGIYFAEKASYSHNYGYVLPTNPVFRQMFIAKVLVGKSYYSKNNKEIKVPPINNETKQRYDSINGNHVDNTKIYIVYDNGKCYPEYLITYSSEIADKNLLKPLGGVSFGMITKPVFAPVPNSLLKWSSKN